MKTQDLISQLAQNPVPAGLPVHQQLRRTLPGAMLACGALLLTFWGLNPDLSGMTTHPAFVTKMLWLAALAVFSGRGLLRLSRPGVSAGPTFWGLALGWLTMAGLGLIQSFQTSSAGRVDLWMGNSWPTCALSILVLSLPLLGALLWVLRQMAPTRPALAGAVAGAMASSMAAGIYSLHCTETAFGFFTVWYGAGMLAVSMLGALLGARLLRW